MPFNHSLYDECPRERTTPADHASEELVKEIARSYRTLPTFEKTMFDSIYRDHYSLLTNELLKCRWRLYKKHIEKRVVEPFLFPDQRDLHFYKGAIRFLPSESTFRFPDYKMKLKPGPGVDSRGQMPIPNELMMKRGGKVVKDKSKIRKASEKEKQEVDKEKKD